MVKSLRGHFCPGTENNFDFDLGALFVYAAQNVRWVFERNLFVEVVDVHHRAKLEFHGLDETAHKIILHRVNAGGDHPSAVQLVIIAAVLQLKLNFLVAVLRLLYNRI